MNPLVRRRLAFGAVTAATSLVVGLVGLVAAPTVFAATNGLVISPSAVQNTNAAASLTFTGQDTDFSYGADMTFNLPYSAPFTISTQAIPPPAVAKANSATTTQDFTDMGTGLGKDGPADAGTYNVTSVGAASNTPPPIGAPGGGTDNCTNCFTVLSAGPVAVASVAPNSVRPNTKGNVSIVGNSFERGTQVQFFKADGSRDTGITVAAPTSDNTDTGAPVDSGITTRTQLQRRVAVVSGSSRAPAMCAWSTSMDPRPSVRPASPSPAPACPASARRVPTTTRRSR